MIWSIIPEELIFAAEPREDRGWIDDHQGRKVRLWQGRIDLLLSSDPLEFLERRFFRGAAVDNSAKNTNN